jgi:coenzyme F420-dependent glucose-6-phosphate dehydrogenase
MTVRFGYTLSSEEHAPATLVRNAVRAEHERFDFVAISDHFHPWVQNQGHSPFVWTVLGGIAASTSRIGVATGVTCPIVRIHPAVVAHAAATTAQLLQGRFSLGVGTGEALNEHVLGHRWPTPEVRLDMLDEAVDVMRQLFTGETVDHEGRFYRVENARLFDPPGVPVPIIVSGFGPAATELAGRIGDGYWGRGSSRELVETYRRAGGTGPVYAQLKVCLGDDEAKCRETVHRNWPNAAMPGQLGQDLPTWTHFEQVAQLVSEEDATASILCGPDLDAVIDQVRTYVDNGYDHIHLHQIGPDQDAFFDRWERGLRDGLQSLVA